jgi:hypothetical protein
MGSQNSAQFGENQMKTNPLSNPNIHSKFTGRSREFPSAVPEKPDANYYPKVELPLYLSSHPPQA